MTSPSRPSGFRVVARDPSSTARLGLLHTAHGSVETPAFMPVGTVGSVKGVAGGELRSLGARVVLMNAYHLSLRPGAETVEALGGAARFAGWDGPVLTDSGGYQVMSLRELRRLDEDGVTFRSHLDGSEHRFTPESVVDLQRRLGVDVAMVLDECVPLPSPREVVEAAAGRTSRWAARARAARLEPGQQLFGIVQGGVHEDLREKSAREITALGFDGHAIGGLAVGETAEERDRVVGGVCPLLPDDRPRYLMGVGTPADLLAAVRRGVDLFDCVLPTRNARNGQVFTRSGPRNLRNARYARDPAPIDDACRCPACRGHSRAYLRHLFVSHEMLGPRLATLHNLHFYLDWMREMREAISRGDLATLVAPPVRAAEGGDGEDAATDGRGAGTGAMPQEPAGGDDDLGGLADA